MTDVEGPGGPVRPSSLPIRGAGAGSSCVGKCVQDGTRDGSEYVDSFNMAQAFEIPTQTIPDQPCSAGHGTRPPGDGPGSQAGFPDRRTGPALTHQPAGPHQYGSATGPLQARRRPPDHASPRAPPLARPGPS